jgi:hypothetical protein
MSNSIQSDITISNNTISGNVNQPKIIIDAPITLGYKGDQGIQGIQGDPPVWGLITGELSSQLDLLSALDAKQDNLTEIDSSEIDISLVSDTLTASLITGSIDVLKLDSGVQLSLGKADSALQSGDNISELINDAGYLTSESDTLQSVTDRGATTTNSITTGGLISNGNVGIGTALPDTQLHIVSEALINGRETLIKANVSDAGNDQFGVGNGTSAGNNFAPTFYGAKESVYGSGYMYSLNFRGMIPTNQDLTNTNRFGIINFETFMTDDMSDPMNSINVNPIANRTLYTFANRNEVLLQINADGNVLIGTVAADSESKFVVRADSNFEGMSIKAPDGPRIFFDEGTAGSEVETAFIGLQQLDNAFVMRNWGGTGTEKLFVLQSGGSRQSVADLDVMTMLHNGNVGIGTTTPERKLSIKGDLDGIRLTNVAGNYIELNNTNSLQTIESDEAIFMKPQNTYIGFWNSDQFGFYDNKDFKFGQSGSQNSIIRNSTDQTNNALLIGLDDSGSRSVIVSDKGDKEYNFAHTNQVNPTIFIHSAAQSTTEWLSLAHDGTNAVFGIGSGDYIFSDGNVGIGTATQFGAVGDEAILFIQQTAFNKIGVDIDYPQATTDLPSTYPQLVIRNTDGTDGNWARISFADAGTSAAAAMMGTQFTDHTNNYGEYVFWTRGATDWAERMRIDSNGNVGIGTSSPDELLHVFGTSNRLAVFGDVGTSTQTSTPVNVSFGSTYGSGVAGSKANLKWDLFTSASSGSRYGIGMSTNLMEFQAGPNGGLGFFVNQGTEAMRILSNGNVGIGTSNPNEKLEVDGQVKVEDDAYAPDWSSNNTVPTKNSIFDAIRRVGFSAKKSSTAISSNTWTTAAFQVEIEDTDNAFNGSVFTVPAGQGGMYDVGGVFVFDSINDGSIFIVGVAVNGTTVTDIIGRGTSGGNAFGGAGGGVKLLLSAGDTIRLLVYCANACNGATVTDGYCSFSAYKMLD